MSTSDSMDAANWQFFRFGLLVTGKAEEDFLPRLFRSLEATGKCQFEVIRRIGQRSPVTSQKRKLKMIGTGKIIPDRDESEIGLPARRFLTQRSSFVILVDDLEHARADTIKQVFERYRNALDAILGIHRHRASVHFLAQMLEAYYFADAKAINAVLGTGLVDYDGDVETIRHPKGELRKLPTGFNEVDHGRQIVALLDVPHVLSNPQTCASLRTLFGWCSAAIGEQPSERYQLVSGRYSEVTRPQVERLSTDKLGH